MLRDFFKEHRKIDIGTQTHDFSREDSQRSAPAVMENPKSNDEHYNFPPPPAKKPPSILYADKYCELTKVTLKIFNFPEGSNASLGTKLIRTADIKKVYYQEQDGMFDCCSVGIVGKSGDTLWAHGNNRYSFSLCCSPPSTETNIVLDCGKSLKLGFSLEDGIGFVSLLKAAFKGNIEFIDNLP